MKVKNEISAINFDWLRLHLMKPLILNQGMSPEEASEFLKRIVLMSKNNSRK